MIKTIYIDTHRMATNISEGMVENMLDEQTTTDIAEAAISLLFVEQILDDVEHPLDACGGQHE